MLHFVHSLTSQDFIDVLGRVFQFDLDVMLKRLTLLASTENGTLICFPGYTHSLDYRPIAVCLR